jgi:hypothetical protein
MIQLVTPNPHIPCKPGWCLAYVNEAFGVAKRYGSATAAWNGSKTQHRDRNFPPGVWVPVWYGLVDEPLGHVVLLAPDGSCYSTSDLSNKPYHHPNLAHLEAFYAYYGMTLTYRGWTEDVEDTPVVSNDGINYSGTITPASEEDDPLAGFSREELVQIAAEGTIQGLRTKGEFQDGRSAIDHLNQVRTELGNTKAAVEHVPATILYEQKEDGRGVMNWFKQLRADIYASEQNAPDLDVDALATALADRLPKADAEALVDALAARLAGGK